MVTFARSRDQVGQLVTLRPGSLQLWDPPACKPSPSRLGGLRRERGGDSVYTCVFLDPSQPQFFGFGFGLVWFGFFSLLLE